MLYVKQGGEDLRPETELIVTTQQEEAPVIIPDPPEQSESVTGYVDWMQFPYAKGFYIGTSSSELPSKLQEGMSYWSNWQVPNRISVSPGRTRGGARLDILGNVLHIRSYDMLLFYTDRKATVWTVIPPKEREDRDLFMKQG